MEMPVVKNDQSGSSLEWKYLKWLLLVCGLVAGIMFGSKVRALPAHGLDELLIYTIDAESTELDVLKEEIDLWGYFPKYKTAIAPLDADQLRRVQELGFEARLDMERTQEHALAVDAVSAAEAHAGTGIPGFPCYRTVTETYDDLSAAAGSLPNLAQWNDFGDSWLKTAGQGGHDLRVLVLTNRQIPGPKPPFILMAAMHAREYATAEIATRFALHLLNGYGTDPEATWLLDHREIHIVAQQNPDGRVEAQTGLSWRKNVNNDHCSNSNARGIDLNRNSTFFWGGPASSGQSCSETYRGPSAASEPETEAIEDYMAAVFTDQKGDMADPAPDTAEGVFISIHSFGQLVLFPWEGTNNDSPNHSGLRTLGRRFGFFTDYEACQDCLGTASGTTVDAAYGEYGVAAYTFEVGTSFFQSCNDFDGIYNENLPAMIYAAKVADLPYLKPSGPTSLNVQLSAATVNAGDAVTVTATVDDSRFDSNGHGTEPSQSITAARVGFDLATVETAGTLLAAADGTFDSVAEPVTGSLDTTGLGPGRHLVYVVGQDASGQWGPATAAFLQVEVSDSIFEDGFESGDVTGWSSSLP